MPKLYFLDTGLCSYLTGWQTPQTLESGAMNGAILETYVISEILKSYWHNGKRPSLYFYRDKQQKEIDLLIERNGTLYPIEIKKHSNPQNEDIKNFSILEKSRFKIGQGCVLCLASKHFPINKNVNVIPIGYL